MSDEPTQDHTDGQDGRDAMPTPSEHEHEQLRELLGEHALGRLEADEQAQVEAHLAGCAECRDDLADIAGLGSLLRRVDLGRIERDAVDQSALPADLTPELEAAINARLAGTAVESPEPVHAVPDPTLPLAPEASPAAPVIPLHPARRRLATLLASAAALLLVGGIGGWWLAPRPPEVPFEPVTVAVAPAGDDLTVTAGVIPHTWGVEVRMTATGFTDGEHYVVQVLDDTGTPRDAGEFVGTGDRRMVCNLNSSVLRADATGFVVLDETGETVASSSFTAT